MEKLSVLILTLVTILTCNAQSLELYDLKTPMESRSISFENPEGKPGSVGKAADKQLGSGRKGAPFKILQPGETAVLCDIKHPGTSRHIWMAGWSDGQSLMMRKQIGCCYYKTVDDWSTATFWYEPVSSAPLPKIQTLRKE